MITTFMKLARMAWKARRTGDRAGLDHVRRLAWELDNRLSAYAESGPQQVPPIPLRALVPDAPVQLRPGQLNLDDGGTSPYERFCIAAIVQATQPRTVFEIGTFKGQTTALLARHAPDDATIYTLDIRPDDIGAMCVAPDGGDLTYIQKPQIGEYVRDCAQREKIHQLYGDSLRFDFAPYHGQCDLVFVDAGHSYECVKSDTANALKLVAPGAVILWHDYKPGCPGLLRALHEYLPQVKMQHIAGTSLVVHGCVAAQQAAVDHASRETCASASSPVLTSS